jgi:oxygen-independent coproporphyrinogen-3 oxidase
MLGHRDGDAVFRPFGVRFEAPGTVPTAAEVASWYASPPGLYLHIPFCRTICPFCPYNKVRYEEELATHYMALLERECRAYLEVFDGRFPSLYVGGGTPTLCLDELSRIVTRLSIEGERAIEVLPGHMTREGTERIRDLGFDYVSVDVQSFDPGVLRRLRRPGSPRTNRKAIANASRAFDCVDVDLIFDAAYDDPETLFEDLSICFDHGVEQISTYPLMRFGYTPFGKGRHDRHREHAVLREATQLAHDHGYERRSVWTFNKRGAPSYTSITRPCYLGMGAGAASFAGSVFAVNHFGLHRYAQAVSSGRLPLARIARLPASAAAAYRWFWQAYTGVIPLQSGDPQLEHPVSVLLRGLSRLMGWARRTEDVVRLTESGYDRYHDLERWVTYHLIEPLWAEMMTEHEDTPGPVDRPPEANVPSNLEQCPRLVSTGAEPP